MTKLFPSPLPKKRFRVVFHGGQHVDFGQRGGQTFVDHGDVAKRKAYLARHSRGREDWNDPRTAGALARWVLWGPYPSLERNFAYFKQRFRLP